MDYKATNSFLRDFLLDIINKGYSSNKLCYLLLGQQSLGQFKTFLDEGTDLGIKPLNRMFNSVGYELSLVPVKKGSELPDSSKELWNNWYEDTGKSIVEFLNQPQARKERTEGSGINLSKNAKSVESALLEFIKSQEEKNE